MTATTVNWQPAGLEDNLVKLVPLGTSDFESLYAVAADPLIWEQHPANDRYKREMFQAFFDGAVASGTAFLITDKASGEIIGSTRYYDYQPGNASIAIGFTFLARKYWGGQYNTAAKRLLLEYAFQFAGKVYFHIGATNLRSQIATMKFGATKVKETIVENNGQSQLHYEYVILKEDWK